MQGFLTYISRLEFAYHRTSTFSITFPGLLIIFALMFYILLFQNGGRTSGLLDSGLISVLIAATISSQSMQRQSSTGWVISFLTCSFSWYYCRAASSAMFHARDQHPSKMKPSIRIQLSCHGEFADYRNPDSKLFIIARCISIVFGAGSHSTTHRDAQRANSNTYHVWFQ